MTMRNALSLAVLASLAFTACGDPSGPDGDSNRPLTFTTSETGDPESAVMRVDNGAGLSLSMWTNSGDTFGETTQALYKDTKSGVRQRVAYSTTTGLPTLTYNESTGETVKIIYGDSRIDFWGFNSSNQFMGGAAVTYKDGELQVSEVTSRPIFSGQVSAVSNNVSFSVFARPDAGLSSTFDAPSNVNAFFGNILDNANDSYSYNTALLAAAGVMLAGGSTQSGIRLPSNAQYASIVNGQPWNFPVFVSYGIAAVVVIGTVLPKIADINTEIIEEAFDAALVDGVSDFKDPFDRLKEVFNDIEDSFSLPSIDLPKITRKDITDAIEETYRSVSSFPNPTSGPPSGSSTVEGAGVDNSGTSYPLSGTITGQGQLTVNGTSNNGRTLNVNGTVTTTSFTGTYSGSAGTGNISGTVAALGKCQQQTASGGQGTFARTYDMGATSGSISFSYEAYSIPDAFQVIAGGTTVLSTGMISGGGTRTFQLNGSSYVSVVVSAPQSGTAWDFELGCP